MASPSVYPSCMAPSSHHPQDPLQPQNVVMCLKNIIQGRLRPLPSRVSPECADLIRALLHRDPAQRITLPQVAAHPWLAAHSVRVLLPPAAVGEGPAGGGPGALPPVVLAAEEAGPSVGLPDKEDAVVAMEVEGSDACYVSAESSAAQDAPAVSGSALAPASPGERAGRP